MTAAEAEAKAQAHIAGCEQCQALFQTAVHQAVAQGTSREIWPDGLILGLERAGLLKTLRDCPNWPAGV